jgi:hypothetical protein
LNHGSSLGSCDLDLIDIHLLKLAQELEHETNLFARFRIEIVTLGEKKQKNFEPMFRLFE